MTKHKIKATWISSGIADTRVAAISNQRGIKKEDGDKRHIEIDVDDYEIGAFLSALNSVDGVTATYEKVQI